MTVKEKPLKQLYDLYLFIYKGKHCEEYLDIIAAQFRLEDFVKEAKLYTKGLDQECELQYIMMEMEDIKKSLSK